MPLSQSACAKWSSVSMDSEQRLATWRGVCVSVRRTQESENVRRRGTGGGWVWWGGV